MSYIKLLILSTFLLTSNVVLHAQEDSIFIVHTDSALQHIAPQPDDYLSTKTKYKGERLFKKRWVQSTFIGVPLIIGGLIEMHHNNHFRSMRNSFLPYFKSSIDDKIQYTPTAIMLGMKLAGVKGKTPWKKMLVANASAILLHSITTYSIKSIVHEERPDATANNSFPSGHTATAFMSATMLSKEYGHISPWISVGGYSIATATGVMRMMNNRHWMSDILAGAGIGIMSAEFGYWIADALFPKSKKSYDPDDVVLSDADSNPSFFGIYAGFYAPLRDHNITEKVRSSTGGTAGFEGAYFFHDNWGIGGQFGVSDINYITKSKKEIVGSMHFYTTQAGAYFSLPLYERLFLGAKVIGGTTFYPAHQTTTIQEERKIGLCATTGLSLGLRAKQHFDVKFNADYSTMPSIDRRDNNRYHMLVLSGQAMIRF